MDLLITSPALWAAGLGSTALAHTLARQVRLRLLREEARRQIPLPAEARKSMAAQARAFSADPANSKELGTYAAVTAAEYVWSWAAIDPSIILAASFSSDGTLRNGLDFAQFVHTHYDSLSAAGQEGFFNRLLGYLGEQQVADLLSAQGHVVEFATTANQPIWDLLVDGNPVNVKTVADLATIKAEAMANPDVTYLVPEDAAGVAEDNIQRLAGFSHELAKASLEEGILSAKGETAEHALGMHIPWITLGFAVYRNVQAARKGVDPGRAVAHTLIETVGRGAGVMLGAKIGGALGSLGGPMAGIIGGILGGIGGAILGGAVAEDFKQRPLRNALEEMQQSLRVFGKSFEARLDDVESYLLAPYRRMQRSLAELRTELTRRKQRLRWWLWPDFHTVLLEEAAQRGEMAVAAEGQRVRPVCATLEEVRQTGCWEKLGLIMMNAPIVCELADASPHLMRQVRNAQRKVFHERKQLNPNFVAPPLPPDPELPTASEPQPSVRYAGTVCTACGATGGRWGVVKNGRWTCGRCDRPL